LLLDEAPRAALLADWMAGSNKATAIPPHMRAPTSRTDKMITTTFMPLPLLLGGAIPGRG